MNNPNTSYRLALSKAGSQPYSAGYVINNVTTDKAGKCAGQSTGLVKTLNDTSNFQPYRHVILFNDNNKEVELNDDL